MHSLHSSGCLIFGSICIFIVQQYYFQTSGLSSFSYEKSFMHFYTTKQLCCFQGSCHRNSYLRHRARFKVQTSTRRRTSYLKFFHYNKHCCPIPIRQRYVNLCNVYLYLYIFIYIYLYYAFLE